MYSMSKRIIRNSLTSHSARHLISEEQIIIILLTQQFWKIAVSAFSSLSRLKVHFGVSMAYPKIIRRPAKPPEEYAYLDVSVRMPSKDYCHCFLFNAHRVFSCFFIFPLPEVKRD